MTAPLEHAWTRAIIEAANRPSQRLAQQSFVNGAQIPPSRLADCTMTREQARRKGGRLLTATSIDGVYFYGTTAGGDE